MRASSTFAGCIDSRPPLPSPLSHAQLRLLDLLQEEAAAARGAALPCRFAVICCRQQRDRGLAQCTLVRNHRGAVAQLQALAPDELRALLAERHVTVLTSAQAGLGKTAHIAEAAEALGCRALRSCAVAGHVSRRRFVRRLLALQLDPEDALHVDVAPCENPDAARLLLLELLLLGTVAGGAGARSLVHVNARHIFVELANAVGGQLPAGAAAGGAAGAGGTATAAGGASCSALEAAFPFLAGFAREELAFDLGRFRDVGAEEEGDGWSRLQARPTAAFTAVESVLRASLQLDRAA